MRKWCAVLGLASMEAFALSLEQVQMDLQKNSIAKDSVEMNIKTTIRSAAGEQSVFTYFVQKGTEKIYAEIKTPFAKRRSIVNGNRVKTVNLISGEVQIVPYQGETFDFFPDFNFARMASGEWEEPKLLADSIFVIEGPEGTLFYNASEKRIEELISENFQKTVNVKFSYDAANRLKSVTVKTSAQGLESAAFVDVLKLCHSKNFPDRLFEF